MKITKNIVFLFFALFCFNMAIAQEPNLPAEPLRKSGLAIGGLASTNGLGVNIVYALNKRFAVRGGFEQLSFSRDFNFMEDEIDYDATLNFKTGSFSLLADYYFFRHIYITGGLGFNRFNPVIEGHAVSDLKYGDISIPPEQIGNFSITVEPGLKISPYMGLGFGRNIGLKRKVAFNFEVGSYYMGSPDVSIYSTGLLSPTSDPVHGQKDVFEKQLASLRFYPVLKMGISVKLF